MIEILEKELIEGGIYDIGLNDGKAFNEVVFVGETTLNRKPMLVFETKQQKALYINPSYQSFAIESDDTK